MTDLAPPPTLTDAEIKAFLEKAALYESRSYSLQQNDRVDVTVQQIELRCPVCEKEKTFVNPDFSEVAQRRYNQRQLKATMSIAARSALVMKTSESFISGVHSDTFECVTCQSNKVFNFLCTVTKNVCSLMKFGEYPRRESERDKNLERFFRSDKQLYRNATICLDHGLGIAALAYFRRIVEENIDRLIDMLKEDSEATAGDPVLIAELGSLHDKSHEKDRIAVAKRALPPHLSVGGINPLARIYEALSDGLHSRSDEECLTTARTLNECLVYLVSTLADRLEQRKRFAEGIRRLSEEG